MPNQFKQLQHLLQQSRLCRKHLVFFLLIWIWFIQYLRLHHKLLIKGEANMHHAAVELTEFIAEFTKSIAEFTKSIAEFTKFIIFFLCG